MLNTDNVMSTQWGRCVARCFAVCLDTKNCTKQVTQNPFLSLAFPRYSTQPSPFCVVTSRFQCTCPQLSGVAANFVLALAALYQGLVEQLGPTTSTPLLHLQHQHTAL